MRLRITLKILTAGDSVISGPANDYYSTTINVYDSLGNSLPMTVTFAPQSSTAGNWNAYYSINGTAAQRPSLTPSTDSSPVSCLTECLDKEPALFEVF